jgi:hypothetical protein
MLTICFLLVLLNIENADNLYPVEGYITPGMEVTFEVTFEPKQEKKDIRYDVSIKINIHEMKNKKKI